ALLIKGEQTSSQVERPRFILAFLGQIQNVEIFSVTVVVEKLVGVIEENALRIGLCERLLFRAGNCLDRLTESSGILKGKPFRAEAFPFFHPFLAARSAMSFIHEDKVVTLEGINRHRLLARGLSQFVDIDNVHAAPGEER